MAIIPPALSPISRSLDTMLPDKYIVRIQETLIRAGMYVKASDLITLVLLSSILLGLIAMLLFLLLGTNPLIGLLLGLLTPLLIIGGWLFISMERRVDAVETATPDFLRQIASLLRAGTGIETAMEDISKHGKGPLNDELKRAVIEIKIGSTFDEALLSMGERLKSKNLDRTFRMILEGRRVGGSLAEVLETVAEDLRAVLSLKRERKANVMMSVMFLIIAAIIAAPFALGMIVAYSMFIASVGTASPLTDAATTAAGGYIIIHSAIVGILIGIVLYGNPKKGVKFTIPLVLLSYGIFYVIKTFGPSLLGF